MNKIQFAAPLKTFQGEDMKEDDPRGMPDPIHKVLRATLLQAGAAQGLVDVLDALTRPQRTLTLGDVCVRSLNAAPQDGPRARIDAKEAIERFELQRRILAAEKAMTPLELESKEQTLLKDCLPNANWTPWIVGQACEMIEGKAAPTEEAEPAAAPRRPARAKRNGAEAQPQA